MSTHTFAGLADADDEIEKKFAAKTSLLQRKEDERLAVQKEFQEKKQNETVQQETLDFFSDNFTKEMSTIEDQISQLESISKAKLADYFDAISVSIQKLQKFTTDAAIYNPASRIKWGQQSIDQLQNTVQQKRSEMIPKKKFTFKSKKKQTVEKAVPSKKESEVVGAEKPAVTLTDCGFLDKTGESLEKDAADIQNKDVSLSNLKDCTVKLFGSAGTIHATGLKNCKVFSGPVFRSIFVEDCQDCTFVIACQQLRTHSTTDTHFYLHVTSKAIVEDCHRVEFAPYNWTYAEMDKHYLESGLDRARNNWDDVDDFNWLASDQPSPNWKVLEESKRVTEWTG